MLSSIATVDVIGAIVAVLIFCGCIVVFCARLLERQDIEHWAGLAITLMALPLICLLWVTIGTGRPAIYFVQLYLMIIFLVVEFFLDYVMKSEFRDTRWKAIVYVMLFFGATGGMIGVASNAGRVWMYSAIVLFLTMGGLAFYQRAKTGK